MHVFISYAREDFDSVRSVWSLLKEHNIPAWIDEESLLPGQDWEFQIQKAIRECAVFLACLSTNSVVKRGYVQAELKEALNVFRKIPENEVFIIPLRLEPCDLPMSLERLHFVDFFAPNGPTKLLAGINLCMPVAEPSTSQQLLYPDKVTARGLSLAEWAVLNELKGKPDIRWTPRIIMNAISKNRPQIAEQVADKVVTAIMRLVDAEYLQRVSGDILGVTGKTINLYREQNYFSKDKLSPNHSV